MSQLRSRSVVLTALVAIAAVVLLQVGLYELTRLAGHPWSPPVRFFFLGGLIACVPWAIWNAITMTDGSWSWRIGAEAERWTSHALRKLGPGWHFDYNLVFYDGKGTDPDWITDIDCVAVGPGGIFAISTKWTSDRWDLGDPSDRWIRAAADQAAKNADRLAGPIRVRSLNTEVRPVVVCWGPELVDTTAGHSVIPAGRHRRDVMIVSGARAKDWIPLLQGTCLDDKQIETAYHRVQQWVADHETRVSRRPEERRRLAASTRRLWQLSVAALVVGVLASVGLAGARFRPADLRLFTSLVGPAGGAGSIVYLLAPTVLGLGGLAWARQLLRHCRSDDLRPRLVRSQRLCAAALTTWTLTIVVVSLG